MEEWSRVPSSKLEAELISLRLKLEGFDRAGVTERQIGAFRVTREEVQERHDEVLRRLQGGEMDRRELPASQRNMSEARKAFIAKMKAGKKK
jgi:hypothetical protein